MAHSRMMRNFIILQEDEKDQSISKDKVLSGYVKVETKLDRCKISFYAQNIKADENKCYMALICYKKETKQIVNIGTLPIGKEGKCDTNIEFPINDIAGLGFSAEKIIGAAICKEIQGKVVYLMYGFINGHVPKEDWKKFSSVKCKEADKQEKEEVEVKVIQKEGTEVKTEVKAAKKEAKNRTKEESVKRKEGRS